MMSNRMDTPAEEIEWESLFIDAAAAPTWSELEVALARSGVLVTRYDDYPFPTEEEVWNSVIETRDVAEIRALLTHHVREDQLVENAGVDDFFDGIFDLLLGALADRVGEVYVPPSRLPACPKCGAASKVQEVVYGMPAREPSPEEELHTYFAGCVVDEVIDGRWRCPPCGHFFDYPPATLWHPPRIDVR